MRKFLGTLVLLALLLIAAAAGYAAYRIARFEQKDDAVHLDFKRKYLASLPNLANRTPRPANVILIVFDDLGYGDLGAYGSTAIRTPQIDGLAASGARLTDFYSAAPYCTPSRAGLQTGRYPTHTGLTTINFPDSSPFSWVQQLLGVNRRLPAEEITIADVLRASGYATGAFGKWHLGHTSPSLPNDLGFEEFVGLLHSNDMSPLPLWHNYKIVEPDPVDQTQLTRRYTAEAVKFIEKNRDRPFFAYIPHTFPHIPLYASEDRRGRSRAGLYGDVVEEIDDSIGTLVAALERLGLTHDTLILITSDNGPWFQGSPGAVRGRKNDIFEGGMRVPFIAVWPGRIPAGREIGDIAMGIDVFPTVLDLLRIEPPTDRIIDGRSLLPLLTERGREPHNELLFFKNDQPLALRSGKYKFHGRQFLFPGTQFEIPVGPLVPQGPWLFDLSIDGNESYDITEREPTVAHRLRVALQAHQRELAANPRGWK